MGLSLTRQVLATRPYRLAAKRFVPKKPVAGTPLGQSHGQRQLVGCCRAAQKRYRFLTGHLGSSCPFMRRTSRTSALSRFEVPFKISLATTELAFVPLRSPSLFDQRRQTGCLRVQLKRSPALWTISISLACSIRARVEPRKFNSSYLISTAARSLL